MEKQKQNIDRTDTINKIQNDLEKVNQDILEIEKNFLEIKENFKLENTKEFLDFKSWKTEEPPYEFYKKYISWFIEELNNLLNILPKSPKNNKIKILKEEIKSQILSKKRILHFCENKWEVLIWEKNSKNKKILLIWQVHLTNDEINNFEYLKDILNSQKNIFTYLRYFTKEEISIWVEWFERQENIELSLFDNILDFLDKNWFFKNESENLVDKEIKYEKDKIFAKQTFEELKILKNQNPELEYFDYIFSNWESLEFWVKNEEEILETSILIAWIEHFLEKQIDINDLHFSNASKLIPLFQEKTKLFGLETETFKNRDTQKIVDDEIYFWEKYLEILKKEISIEKYNKAEEFIFSENFWIYSQLSWKEKISLFQKFISDFPISDKNFTKDFTEFYINNVKIHNFEREGSAINESLKQNQEITPLIYWAWHKSSFQQMIEEYNKNNNEKINLIYIDTLFTTKNQEK